MNDSAEPKSIVVRIPMIGPATARAVGHIESALPREVRSAAIVKGILTIDYVDDVVIFEVNTP